MDKKEENANDQIPIMAGDIRKLKRAVNEIQNNSRELIWANIFHDTVCGSTWFLDHRLSLGRAAIGYNFAYVLYRCLDEAHPEDILEMGLGESTQIVMQYMKRSSRGTHTVIEQEKSWTEFWKTRHTLPSNSRICHLPAVESDYGGCGNVLVYDGFESFGRRKYDFILVDGPGHSRCETYARIDLLKILPDCLKKSWIIIFDDCDRQNTKNGAVEVKNLLKESSVPFAEGSYKGKKEVWLICSLDLAYFTTL